MVLVDSSDEGQWAVLPARYTPKNSPMHYLTEGDPDLIVASVLDVVRRARDGARLGEPLYQASDAQ